ncbi:hypothetical protein HED49_22495 [Ochrobactrum daejeonense]|nr:hypothetical protein [Brucella daejeonensis]
MAALFAHALHDGIEVRHVLALRARDRIPFQFRFPSGDRFDGEVAFEGQRVGRRIRAVGCKPLPVFVLQLVGTASTDCLGKAAEWRRPACLACPCIGAGGFTLNCRESRFGCGGCW